MASCEGANSKFGANIKLYPEVAWSISSITIKNEVTLYTGPTSPSWVCEAEGSLTGTFSGTSLSISSDDFKDKGEDASDAMPFFHKIGQSVFSAIDGGNSESSDPTASYIKVNQTLKLADSKYALKEHQNDVGIEAQYSFALDPLLGIKIHLDVIDAVLSAAELYTPAKPLAKGIREARRVAAKGYESEGGNFSAQFNCSIYIEGEASIGAEISVSKIISEDKWSSSAKGGGKVGLSIGASVEAKTKIYFIEGAFSAEGKGSSELELEIAPAEKDEEGKKCNAKCELKWSGVTLEYSSKIQIGWSNEESNDWETKDESTDVNTEAKKKIPLRPGGVLGEIYF